MKSIDKWFFPSNLIVSLACCTVEVGYSDKYDFSLLVCISFIENTAFKRLFVQSPET